MKKVLILSLFLLSAASAVLLGRNFIVAAGSTEIELDGSKYGSQCYGGKSDYYVDIPSSYQGTQVSLKADGTWNPSSCSDLGVDLCSWKSSCKVNVSPGQRLNFQVSWYCGYCGDYEDENWYIEVNSVLGPVCGNGKCESGETCSNCSKDCGACSYCGDGVCNTSTGEDCSDCPSDCPCHSSYCCHPTSDNANTFGCVASNKKISSTYICCSGSKFQGNCCSDSGCSSGYKCLGHKCTASYCGDGTCGSNENCFSCSADCGCSSYNCCAPDSGNADSKGCVASRQKTTSGWICCQGSEIYGNCCFDSDCSSGYACSKNYCVKANFCGDGSCGSGENCSNCSVDCYCSSKECCAPSSGSADSAGCVDSRKATKSGYICCSGQEKKGNCCSDSDCSSGKKCSNYKCSLYCGNGSCDSNENCVTCQADCGKCEADDACGNGNCDSGETCSNCSKDCGTCKADKAYCDYSWQCKSGNCQNYRCCVKGKTCCLATSNCTNDYYCSEERSYCIKRLPDGQFCSKDEMCSSDNCDNGICCEWGQTCCQKSVDCKTSEYCADSVNYCRYKSLIGEKCGGSYMCKSGYCDRFSWTCAEEPEGADEEAVSSQEEKPAEEESAPAASEQVVLSIPDSLFLKTGQKISLLISLENKTAGKISLGHEIQIENPIPASLKADKTVLHVLKKELLPGEKVSTAASEQSEIIEELVLIGRAAGSGEVAIKAVYFSNGQAQWLERKIIVEVAPEHVLKEEAASKIFQEEMILDEKKENHIFVEPSDDRYFQATRNTWQEAQEEINKHLGNLKGDFQAAVEPEVVTFFRTMESLENAKTPEEITETTIRAAAPPVIMAAVDFAKLLDAIEEKKKAEGAFLEHFGADSFTTIGSAKAIIKEEDGEAYAIKIGEL